MKIKTLDTTLRDGGFRNGHNFGEAFSEKVVSQLDSFGLDYIEFSLGIAKKRAPEDYSFLNKIRNKASNAKLAMMCMGGVTTLDDLKNIKACGIDLVRVVFFYNVDPSSGLELLKQAKYLGLEVSANITTAMHWSVKAMTDILQKIMGLDVDIIYIADSCGGMTPQNVIERMAIVKAVSPRHIGFHAHDNIGMALLNCITAVQQGADMIDCSLRGMGNGCGNLKTEIWLTYLNKMCGHQYNMPKILAFTDEFEQRIPESSPAHSTRQVMMGYLDLHEKPEHYMGIERLMDQEGISWFEAARKFNDRDSTVVR